MPKQRTHSGAKKRFRVSKTGKVLHANMNLNHILEKKASRRKRRLRRGGELTAGSAAQVKKLLTGR